MADRPTGARHTGGAVRRGQVSRDLYQFQDALELAQEAAGVRKTNSFAARDLGSCLLQTSSDQAYDCKQCSALVMYKEGGVWEKGTARGQG